MCGTDDLITVSKALEFADELLSDMGVGILKALDLSTARGFDTAVARFAAELRRHTRRSEADAVRLAIATLDVDWRQTSPAQRAALVRRALEASGRHLKQGAERIRVPLGRAAEQVVQTARAEARRKHRLAIAADFNAVDRRAVAHVARSSSLFVRDEYGRRLDHFGEHVRATIARGLEHGLGRQEIAEDIAVAAEQSLVRRSRSYWELLASSFVGEGRSLAQLSAYAEAGVEHYVLHAVLDEQTTNTCRFLHGKVLRTGDGLRAFSRLERARDAFAIKRERPWIRERVGTDGKPELFFRRDEDEMLIAVVERSGVGTRDDSGDYSRTLAPSDFAPAGISMPPFHGHCRSTVLAL